MRDAGSEDLWASSAVGARLIAGWACTGLGALDLSMGLGPRPYLIFHAVVLAGGLLLLTMGRLPKTPRPLGYAVTAALAVLALVVAALPRTSAACCMRGLAIRHGYPLTMAAWDDGQKHHFSAGHAAADLLFWCLAGLILLVAVTLALPRRASPALATRGPSASSATPTPSAVAVAPSAAAPSAPAPSAPAPSAAAPPAVVASSAVSTSGAEVAASGRRSTHAEERLGSGGGHDRAADDENVGGLP